MTDTTLITPTFAAISLIFVVIIPNFAAPPDCRPDDPPSAASLRHCSQYNKKG